MKTRIFILCAGKNVKYYGITRQLLKINGEEILGRTIRLIKEQCNDEIFIVTRNNVIEDYIRNIGNNRIILFQPYGERYHMESLYSTKEKWVDKNIFLFGDVVFSKYAIKKILNSNNNLSLFFRIRPHLYLNKRYPEMFGILIPISESKRMLNIILSSYESASKDGGASIFYNIYSELGIRMGKKYLNFESYKSRSLISKLCINDFVRGIFYKKIRSFEGRLIRFIFYKTRLTKKRKNALIKTLLGKKIPDYNKDLLSSKYIVEIHDITDDIDHPIEYKDYIKQIVKKGLLKENGINS